MATESVKKVARACLLRGGLCAILFLCIAGRADAARLILRIQAGNPIEKPQSVEIKANLPARVRTNNVIDLDGLELDFQRFPMYFKPGEEAQHLGAMTAWMREIRSMTKEVGEKRGRPILLCARIMARPEQNRAIGLDPIAWANEGLLDFVTVSHYLRNDYPLPIRAYRELLPITMPIYASIEVAPSTDAFRRLARQLWKDQVDGVYLFNFFTKREGGREPPYELLDELGRPDTVPAEVR